MDTTPLWKRSFNKDRRCVAAALISQRKEVSSHTADSTEEDLHGKYILPVTIMPVGVKAEKTKSILV